MCHDGHTAFTVDNDFRFKMKYFIRDGVSLSRSARLSIIRIASLYGKQRWGQCAKGTVTMKIFLQCAKMRRIYESDRACSMLHAALK